MPVQTYRQHTRCHTVVRRGEHRWINARFYSYATLQVPVWVPVKLPCRWLQFCPGSRLTPTSRRNNALPDAYMPLPALRFTCLNVGFFTVCVQPRGSCGFFGPDSVPCLASGTLRAAPAWLPDPIRRNAQHHFWTVLLRTDGYHPRTLPA